MHDPTFEALLRDAVANRRDVTQTPMFGGLALMLGGCLPACACHDGMLVRSAKAGTLGPLRCRGQRSCSLAPGPCRAGCHVPALAADPAIRARALTYARDFVATLPPK